MTCSPRYGWLAMLLRREAESQAIRIRYGSCENAPQGDLPLSPEQADQASLSFRDAAREAPEPTWICGRLGRSDLRQATGKARSGRPLRSALRTSRLEHDRGDSAADQAFPAVWIDPPRRPHRLLQGSVLWPLSGRRSRSRARFSWPPKASGAG